MPNTGGMTKRVGFLGKRFLSSLSISIFMGGAFCTPQNKILKYLRGRRIFPLRIPNSFYFSM
jgi:hypothetical protein